MRARTTDYIERLLEYEEYLQGPVWAEKRRKVMERVKRTHGGMCEGCGERNAVEVHHLNYPRRLGEERLWELVGVCGKCHEELHEWRRRG